MSPLLERIKRLLPEKQARPKSLDEYLELLQNAEGEITRVTALPQRGMRTRANSSTVGHIGINEYSTVYEAETSTGRKLRFKESYGEEGESFGSERGFADARKRNLMFLRTLVTADHRLKRIDELFPSAEVIIVKPTGEPLTPELYEKLQQDKRKHDISPFN